MEWLWSEYGVCVKLAQQKGACFKQAPLDILLNITL